MEIDTDTKSSLPSHLVSKPTPYMLHPSHLTTTDPNPLPPTSSLLALPHSQLNATLQDVARDAAQSLISHLLTTTTIQSTPTGLTMQLPPADPPLLPRWKPLPKPKAPTKWETFARKKGIGKFGGSTKGGAALQEKRKNATFNEETGEWEKKWGYKGRGMREGQEWLVEVDDKAKKVEDAGRSVRAEPKRERMERMRRLERKERKNAKGKGGG
jgi:regulator of ribosome biosynthesis